jgi:hypothetical protein
MRKLLSEPAAVGLLHLGQRLMCVHTRRGVRWFIDGQEVAGGIAHQILARPDVRPADPGLFPDCPQTYRFRGGGS